MSCSECTRLATERDSLRSAYARELRSLVDAEDSALSADEFRKQSESAATARLRLEKARAALQEHKLTCGGQAMSAHGAG